MRTPREAAVFVHRDGQYLLLRRAGDGYWHTVAGVVEPGESFVSAAARELLEETGLGSSAPLLDLGIRQPHGIPPELQHEYPSDCDEVVIETFAAAAPTGWEPTLNEEHVQYRWTDVREAVRLLYWPEARDALALLDQRLTAERGRA